MRLQVRSLASLSGLRIWYCRELWCSSQMWLGSDVAVTMAQVSSCSSDLPSSLGTSICHGCGPKNEKKKWIQRENRQQYNYSKGLNYPTFNNGQIRQKIIVETLNLNYTLDQTNRTNIQRTFQPSVTEYTFSSCVYRTFSRTDHTLGHKTYQQILKD